MPTITALTPHLRKADRYHVQVDGEPLVVTEGAPPVVVDAALILELKLRAGVPYTPELALQVAEGALRVHALDRALTALARRSHSAMELRRSLARKEIPRAVVDDVIDRLAAIGLVDDLAFARGFALSRLVGRGQGAMRVRAELSRRGVSRGEAERAVASVLEEEEVDVLGQVRRLAARRLQSLSKLEPAVQRRRLTAFLLRRGFDGASVRTVLQEVLPGRGY